MKGSISRLREIEPLTTSPLAALYTRRMEPDSSHQQILALEGVPDAVGRLVETLAAAGHAGFLVGG